MLYMLKAAHPRVADLLGEALRRIVELQPHTSLPGGGELWLEPDTGGGELQRGHTFRSVLVFQFSIFYAVHECMAAVACIPFVWFMHMQYSIPTGLLLPPLPLLVCCRCFAFYRPLVSDVWCVNEEFSGWSDRLNAENVECYCFQLPGSGSRRQASEQACGKRVALLL